MPTTDHWIRVAGASFEILRSDRPLELRLVGSDEGHLSPEERRAWDRAARDNPHVFDAPMLCVERVLSPFIEVRRTSYSRFLADRQRSDRSIHPLAVSGYILAEGRLLVGRRPADVTQYPGWFEAIPSGAIEQLASCDVVDPIAALLGELQEETGITATPGDVGSPVLVFDNHEQVYDLCFQIRTPAKVGDMIAAARARGHYQEIEFCHPDDVAGQHVVPTTAAIAWLLKNGRA